MEHYRNVEDLLSAQFEKDGEKDELGNPIIATGKPITKDEYWKEKNNSITSKIQSIYEKSKKQEGQTLKDEQTQSYTTQEGEKINFKSLFVQTETNGDRPGTDGLQWDPNSIKNSYNRVANPDIFRGIYASVEVKYTETGMFDFTSRGEGKIKSAKDVAFIFRKLESQSVEHAFAVYVDKKDKAFVQWLGMGGMSAVLVDPKLMADAAIRFNAEKVYFIHNHPSGNLEASKEDFNVARKLEKGFGEIGISVECVIINLDSGKYAVIDTVYQDTGKHDGFNQPENEPQQPVSIYTFSQRAFLTSPLNGEAINTSKRAAQFISQERFSSAEKYGYLLLDRSGKVMGNFFGTTGDIKEATKEVMATASGVGASSLIAYTNKSIGKNETRTLDNKFFTVLKKNLDHFDLNLLDVIIINPSDQVMQTREKYYGYKSLADEGLLEPEGKYVNSNKPDAKLINDITDFIYGLYITHNGQTKQELEKRITDDLRENNGGNLLQYLKKHLEESKWNYEQSHTNETAGIISRVENYLNNNTLNENNPPKELPVPTELELKVLEGIVHSDFQSFDIDNPLIVNSPVWSVSVTDGTKQLAGALGSCVKKGWAACSTDAGDRGNEECCWLTAAGRDILLENQKQSENLSSVNHRGLTEAVNELRKYTEAIPDKHRAFTLLVRGGKWEVGVADLNVLGVTRTGVFLPSDYYDQALKDIVVINKSLFPNNTATDNFFIEASSYKKPSQAKEEDASYISGIEAYNIHEIKNNLSPELKESTPKIKPEPGQYYAISSHMGGIFHAKYLGQKGQENFHLFLTTGNSGDWNGKRIWIETKDLDREIVCKEQPPNEQYDLNNKKHDTGNENKKANIKKHSRKI